jgi:hypothetical protein
MVLAYLAASLAKQGGRPPSPRTAMAMMAALLAAQITWTVTKHQSARLGDPASIAPSSASVVDDEGFSLALGVRRADAGGGEGAGGMRGRRPGMPVKTSGDGFESWWLGELDEPPGRTRRGERR